MCNNIWIKIFVASYRLCCRLGSVGTNIKRSLIFIWSQKNARVASRGLFTSPSPTTSLSIDDHEEITLQYLHLNDLHRRSMLRAPECLYTPYFCFCPASNVGKKDDIKERKTFTTLFLLLRFAQRSHKWINTCIFWSLISRSIHIDTVNELEWKLPA